MGAHTEGPRRPGRRLLGVHFVAILFLWPAFTGSFSRDELIAGVGALLLTLWFMRALERCMPVHVRFRVQDLLQAWRLPGEMLRDAGALTWGLLKDLAGRGPMVSRYRLLRWSSHPHAAEVQGREVLLATYVSATPNSIVLGVDQAESLVVLHELVPGPLSALAKSLGAQP